ncbi:MAG: hypothetical protein ACT4PT_04540 [Methanobacteriota archaeon]
MPDVPARQRELLAEAAMRTILRTQNGSIGRLSEAWGLESAELERNLKAILLEGLGERPAAAAGPPSAPERPPRTGPVPQMPGMSFEDLVPDDVPDLLDSKARKR